MTYDHEGQVLESYSKAPLEVLHHKSVRDVSKLVYFELYSIYDQNKKRNDHIFIKDETLAKKLCLAEITVKQSMKELEDSQLIVRRTSTFDKKRQSKKRKIYPILNNFKKNKNNEIRYTEFPKSIYEKKDISNLTKIILIELMSLLDTQRDEFIASKSIHVGMLADTLGIGRRTAINNLSKLEENNYILIEGSGSYRAIQLEKESIYHDFLPF